MVRSSNLKGALHIGGTGSDVGKSILVTGLCRAFVRKGFKVAPFKGQNMALNAEVTKEGGEIGRAQGLQAVACQTSPSVDMNPVLLKPTGQSVSQLIVRGKVAGEIGAKEYQVKKKELSDIVDESFSNLWKSFDLIIAEGAGSVAEINLKGVDLANLGLAQRLGMNSILAADIDRGGVFASIYGTKALV
ncbi:MAG: AAA family ATPase, partial [Acidimicrobiales bacterium]|nr:AAA family ATPase [Acidimicrobiales bacterium]